MCLPSMPRLRRAPPAGSPAPCQRHAGIHVSHLQVHQVCQMQRAPQRRAGVYVAPELVQGLRFPTMCRRVWRFPTMSEMSSVQAQDTHVGAMVRGLRLPRLPRLSVPAPKAKDLSCPAQRHANRGSGSVWSAPTRVPRVTRRWPERPGGAHGVQSAHTRRVKVVGGRVRSNADTMPNTRLPGSARPAVASSAASAAKVWAQKFGLELGVLRAHSHPALPGVGDHVLRIGNSTTRSACRSGSAQTATKRRPTARWGSCQTVDGELPLPPRRALLSREPEPCSELGEAQAPNFVIANLEDRYQKVTSNLRKPRCLVMEGQPKKEKVSQPKRAPQI